MSSGWNCNCNCLIHGDRWTSLEAIKQLNLAYSFPIHLKGRRHGGMVPNFNAKKCATCFRVVALKQRHRSVPHSGQSLHRDGTESPKCRSRSRAAEPVLHGPYNSLYSKVAKIFDMLDENRDYSERYQPIEEPWLSLSSVHSNSADGDIDASDFIGRAETVDVVESASLHSDPLLGGLEFDSEPFMTVEQSLAGNTIVEPGSNFSDTDQPVEEPWLRNPAAKSVNADVGFNCKASTGEQSPNDKENLIAYLEDALQIPEKIPDEVESRHRFQRDSISIEILINSSICSMQRIAVLEDGELVELLLEPVKDKDNVLCESIYLGVVKKKIPHMGGAFIDIGIKSCFMKIQHGKQRPFIFPPSCSSKKREVTDTAPWSTISDQLGAIQNKQRLSDDVEEPDDDPVQEGPTLCINDEYADHEVDEDIDVDEFTSKQSIRAEESVIDSHVNGSLKYEDFSAKYSWDDIPLGTKIVVQVVREKMGSKGPSVTPYPKLKGRFWVLVTCGSKIEISKNITAIEQTRLKVIARALQPPGFGLIVRTVAEGHSREELKKDLVGLLSTWKTLMELAKSAALAAHEGVEKAVPVILHPAMGQTLSVVQDYFSHEVKRMVVDSPLIYHEVTSYLKEIAPDLCDRVEFHSKKIPLFHEFKIEDELNSLLNKRVPLPDGGNLVIEQTEALVSIDVNGGHKMLDKGSSQEKAILDVNLAAAKQIARELRLRDIGGIIVVDFMKMNCDVNRRLIYEEVLKAVERDRSRVHISELSENGLMQITRKRVRPSLPCMISERCSCCQGSGRVESLEFSFSKIEHEISRLLAEMDQRADPEKLMSWPKMLLRVDGTMSGYLTSGKKSRLNTLCWSLKVWIIPKEVRSFTRGAFELTPLTDEEAKNDKKYFELLKLRPAETVSRKSITMEGITKFFSKKMFTKDSRFT